MSFDFKDELEPEEDEQDPQRCKGDPFTCPCEACQAFRYDYYDDYADRETELEKGEEDAAA